MKPKPLVGLYHLTVPRRVAAPAGAVPPGFDETILPSAESNAVRASLSVSNTAVERMTAT